MNTLCYPVDTHVRTDTVALGDEATQERLIQLTKDRRRAERCLYNLRFHKALREVCPHLGKQYDEALGAYGRIRELISSFHHRGIPDSITQSWRRTT